MTSGTLVSPVALVRALSCAVAAAAVALGFVGTAHAEAPLLNGTYGGADDLFTWSIATGCVPAGCTGSVTSNQGWTSPMTLTDGRWDFTVSKPDGAICDDGGYAPVVIWVSIDAESLGGIVTNDSNGECPGGMVTSRPFQLTQLS